MYMVVWRFQPARGREHEFLDAYGPEGAWARLFREADGYLGTDLLRSEDEGGGYLTVDRWRSAADFAAFRRDWRDRYAELDRCCSAWTEDEALVGHFCRLEPES